MAYLIPPAQRAQRSSVAWALLILGVGAIAYGSYRLFNKDWRADVPCAAAGDAEARTQAQFLGDDSAATRYRGLFLYFARGFAAHLTPGGTRVQYCGAASDNSYPFNGLEGFARTAPLLAAWLHSGHSGSLEASAAGRTIDLAALLQQGILHGVDRGAADYWGDMADNDQRVLEAADIARTLWLSRSFTWDRMSGPERARVTAWLLQATRVGTPHDNWMLSPVIIALALVRLDAPTPHAPLLAQASGQFAKYRELYLESGWFYDPPYGVDYYNAWGITYDLFWIQQLNPAFAGTFTRDAIEDSASLTKHLISPHGLPILGRSICYRTAAAVPVVAASLLNPSDPAPNDALRALDAVWRHFVAHDGLLDGALSQGYHRTDLRFLDRYSGPGSCQWGLRSLVLAFMQDRAAGFWTSPAAPLPVEQSDYDLVYPKLGWRILGKSATAEITLEILGNSREVNSPEPYTRIDHFLETLRRRPFRPKNREVKYESRFYSTERPFPLE